MRILLHSSGLSVAKYACISLVVCLLSAITLKDSISLLSRYNSPNNVRTTMKLRHDEPLSFTPTLCVPIDAMAFAVSRINIFDSVAVERFENELAQKPNVMNCIKGMTNDCDYMDEFLIQLLALTTLLIDTISAMESNSLFTWSGPSDLIVYDPYANGRSMILIRLYEILAAHSIQPAELVQNVAQVLCTFMEVQLYNSARVRTNNSTSPYEEVQMCDKRSITWLGRNDQGKTSFLCVRPNAKDAFTFRNANDWTMLQLWPLKFYSTRARIMRELFNSKLRSMELVMDFQGNLVASSESEMLLLTTVGQQVTASLTLTSHYSLLNRPSEPCLEEGSYLTKRLLCRARAILDACNCWPLTYFHLKRNDYGFYYCANFSRGAVENASLISIAGAKCQAIIRSDPPNATCLKHCYRECEVRALSTNMRPRQMYHDKRTVIVLQMEKYTYAQIQEVQNIGPDSLIAQLGGTLSLYVGFSFIGLFNFILHVIRKIGQCRHGKTKQKTCSDKIRKTSDASFERTSNNANANTNNKHKEEFFTIRL